jgi:hypothetical protein
MAEREQPTEQSESVPSYLRASRFRDDRTSERAYFLAQEIIHHSPRCNLSAYRLLLQDASIVAVLGDRPDRRLARELETVLRLGDATTLPDDVVAALVVRRSEAIKLGPWIERHRRTYP